jgi:hypothetical protein
MKEAHTPSIANQNPEDVTASFVNDIDELAALRKPRAVNEPVPRAGLDQALARLFQQVPNACVRGPINQLPVFRHNGIDAVLHGELAPSLAGRMH